MASHSLSTVLSTLKACVISNPDGVEEDKLNSEFRQLMGCNIPWRENGFKSLQDLIKASPSLQIVTRGGCRLVVAETASVEHLSSMIKSQKKTVPRKKAPRRNRFSKISNSYGGSGRFQQSAYHDKPICKKIDFVEYNNNTNVKLPCIKKSPKEINHHNNVRPAGDESSSSSASSLTILPQSQAQKQKSKKEKNRGKKKPDSDEAPKKVVKSVPPSPIPKDDCSVKSSEKPKRVSSVPEPSKKPLLPTPTLKKSAPLLPSVADGLKGSLPFESVASNQYSQPILNVTLDDQIPSHRLVYFSPENLPNTFIPANLVPPKPMKPGWYRGVKRKVWPRTKLMSIKDNSAPSEDSLTAKFINLIKTQDWPEPEYRLLPRIGPNKIEVYGCTVRGSYSLDNNETLLTYDYSTIPDEFSDMNASKEAVSQKAYDDINRKIKEASNYVPVTSNFEDMVNRIHEIVTAFPNGLWAYKVESDYREKYGERLPSKWVDVIGQSDILAAEKLVEFLHVIRPVKKSEEEMPLGELKYPETETWDIYVTKIVSSSQVWFRFVGPDYSDWLDEVTKEMCEHYQEWSTFICPTPIVGEVYVYPSNYGAVRVRLISLDNPDMATVMHIDHGDVEEIPRDYLCVLDHNFRHLPPQAVSCKMFSLDQYSENKLCTAFLMDKVEGTVLVAEIVQTEPLSLTMYDTSLDDPINMNHEILNSLNIDIVSPPSFSLDLSVQEGLVTSIWRTGEIYLQLPNDGMTHLSFQLDALTDLSSELYLAHPDEIVPHILYLVNVNGSWLRATILQPARPINNMVELFLVDTGDIQTMMFTNLVPLNLISMVLCEIPRQALRVRLADTKMYEEAVERLQSMVTPPCKAIVKVVQFASVPEVELFIREHKGLISVNQTLQLEETLANNFNSVSLNNSVTDFATIQQAPTADCGEFFDVYVVSVSNPSNFTVIPRKYINELTKLQDQLQVFYSNADPVYNKLRNFNTGQACAAQHTDGHWYRGLIHQIIDRSKTQLMIRFCDFGNFAMLSADRLLSLDKQFLSLPALGFSASIADILPVSHDWNFLDCLRTEKLMLEQNFVTLIKSKQVIDDQTILKLQVFDTSGERDCDIGKILVEESIAKYCSC